MEEEYIPLSRRSTAELRAKADGFRQMAATARTADIKENLLKLARRFDTLVDQREREGR
jgi:hypothetical protein